LLTYPGVVDLPESTLTFLAGLLAEDRAQRRTWRKLPPPEQALLVLVHLRKGERYEQLAEGFQVRSVIMTACAGTLP
jgi:hypothetical protein